MKQNTYSGWARKVNIVNDRNQAVQSTDNLKKGNSCVFSVQCSVGMPCTHSRKFSCFQLSVDSHESLHIFQSFRKLGTHGPISDSLLFPSWAHTVQCKHMQYVSHFCLTNDKLPMAIDDIVQFKWSMINVDLLTIGTVVPFAMNGNKYLTYDHLFSSGH